MTWIAEPTCLGDDLYVLLGENVDNQLPIWVPHHLQGLAPQLVHLTNLVNTAYSYGRMMLAASIWVPPT